ncbi:MAG TPA: questin oxidase family protein [Thermoanaerobaculia bacterium]|jgi:hypothetical protein
MSPLSRRRFLYQTAAAASAACAAPGIAAASGGSKDKIMSGTEALEGALELLAKTGPEYDGRLANHGPMAAEALVTLERPKAVVPWVERYRKRLRDHPAGTRPIDPKEWRQALGESSRVGDWIAFFDRELSERSWREVLGVWVPRLSPGVIAAAFHGVIRTAHAVRSLDAIETPARRRELAEGLGYWAATYNALPEAPGRRAVGLPSRAIAEVAAVPPAQRIAGGNITDRLAPLDRFPPFAGVADLVDASGDASRFLSDLTETFAAVYLASVPPGSVITYIHTVTGPSAIRLLLPHLEPESRRDLLRYGWQGAAALYAAGGGKAIVSAAPLALASRDDLIDRAIATDDEHAIKFTEACLREHALNPKPVYLQAALDAIARLS